MYIDTPGILDQKYELRRLEYRYWAGGGGVMLKLRGNAASKGQYTKITVDNS
jgi:hypothetical protein